MGKTQTQREQGDVTSLLYVQNRKSRLEMKDAMIRDRDAGAGIAGFAALSQGLARMKTASALF
jgi:hypothetical protein